MMPKYIAPTYSAEQMRDCRRRVSAREERIAELERTLAAVTAQRDQCAEALRQATEAIDTAHTFARKYQPGVNADYYAAHLTDARAALRACENGGAK